MQNSIIICRIMISTNDDSHIDAYIVKEKDIYGFIQFDFDLAIEEMSHTLMLVYIVANTIFVVLFILTFKLRR